MNSISTSTDGPAKPAAPAVQAQNIPDALQAMAQWVLWRYELRNESWTKAPYGARGRMAKVTDSATWLSFADAAAIYERGGYDGIGFVVTEDDDFCGIDLDYAVSEDGSPKESVMQLFERFDTYAECTPSGHGYRLWLRGVKPEEAGCKVASFDESNTNMEIYDEKRYFTVTGRHFTGTPKRIEIRQDELDALCAELWPPSDVMPAGAIAPQDGELSDDEVLRLARAARNGAKFASLFDDGNTSHHRGDESAADLALCCMLAFWCQRDDDQMDRLFRQSALYRRKWDERRGPLTYGERTIQRAIEGCREVYGVHDDGVLLTVALETEEDCALEWIRLHPDWRYTDAFGQWHWYDYDAAIWRKADKLQHYSTVRDLVRRTGRKNLKKAAAVNGIVSLARSNPGTATSAEDWDGDPWLLGTPGAVIDLRTGKPIDDPKAAHITKQTAVPIAPRGTPTPLWEAFLARVTGGDTELIGYLQLIAGYALTGSDREQCLFFAHGSGGNGKGVFINTLTGILGEYAHVASGDLLLEAKGDRHPTDMASLRGKRFVSASELRPGARWDEQRLKSLTGGDPITARFMRQDEFTYRPQFTFVIAGNHRPSFSGVDEAIRRRLRLIPFTATIPASERDPTLPEKLRAEWPGILRWMLEGCLDWQWMGEIGTPTRVKDASQAYLDAEDSIGQWVQDRIVRTDPQLKSFATRKELFEDWTRWVGDNGGPNWGAKTLYIALEERGFLPHIRTGTRGFKDVQLKPKSVLSLE